MTQKFKFEDLQPHVDMLCDALENRGASSSGIPNEDVYPQATAYRKVLCKVRSKEVDGKDLLIILGTLRNETLHLTKNNQRYRVQKIVDALHIYIIKEYNKLE
jgi:hypothetical protein